MSFVTATPLDLAPSAFQVQRSVRIRKSASAFFARTPAVAGNQQRFTWSGWVKLGDLSTLYFMSAGSAAGAWGYFGVAGNALYFTNAAGNNAVQSTMLLRDPSAWYHVVIAVDTTQATAANRVLMYVNGSAVTAFQVTTGYPAQNANTYWNGTSLHRLGSLFDGATNYYSDAYFSEVNFVDGQALTPSAFGLTDPSTGAWVPKRYAGAYGTNGFYLQFADNSAATAAAIGKDTSGNGNNWTPTNVSVTAGSTYDSMLDVPTNWFDGTQYGRGNYATLNPLGTGGGTISDANLTFSVNASNVDQTRYATQAMSGGKFYFEVRVGTAGAPYAGGIGVTSAPRSDGAPPDSSATGWAIHFDGNGVYKRNNGAVTTLYTPGTGNNTYMVAVDTAAGKIWMGRDGAWASGNPAAGTGEAYSGLSGDLTPYVRGYVVGGAWTLQANFGQRPFAYAPPAGFVALNTNNLPEPIIKRGNQWFDATLYTGNGATQSVSNGNFQPDLVWIKNRGTATDHGLFDASRGATRRLASNLTAVETVEANSLTSFNATGFSVGATQDFNQNGFGLVAWQWKRSPIPGFDIQTYTGTGVNGQVISHNLNAPLAMAVIKKRANNTATNTGNWIVLHQSVAATGSFSTNSTLTLTSYVNALLLNGTNAMFTYGYDNQVGGNGDTFVAYLFAQVAGFSRFGSYVGNGSADGPFVFCGFRPRYILTKRVDAVSDWMVYDTARAAFNVGSQTLAANLTLAESSFAATNYYDVLSNGFKLRQDNTNGYNNASGGTYIFAAFAENPFKYANAR